MNVPPPSLSLFFASRNVCVDAKFKAASECFFYRYFDTAFYFLSICGSLNTKCDKQKVVYRWALVRMWPQLSQCVPSCLLSFLLRSSSPPADTALINKSFSCGRHSEAENLFFWQQEIQLILGQNENSCPPEDPLCLVNSS